MGNATPVWTDQGEILREVVAITALGTRGTFDLRGKYQGKILANVGRSGSTAWATFPYAFILRPMFGNLAARAPSNRYGRSGNGVTAAATTLNGATSANATTAILTSASSFAAGELICIGYNTANVEWARISKISSNTITLDAPLINSHSNGDTVTNCADTLEMIVPGGQTYEYVLDNSMSATGPNVQIVANLMTYDSDSF